MSLTKANEETPKARATVMSWCQCQDANHWDASQAESDRGL